MPRFLVQFSFHATAVPLDEKETGRTRNSYVNTRVVDHRNWYENCLLYCLIRVYNSIEGMNNERVTSENVFFFHKYSGIHQTVPLFCIRRVLKICIVSETMNYYEIRARLSYRLEHWDKLETLQIKPSYYYR